MLLGADDDGGGQPAAAAAAAAAAATATQLPTPLSKNAAKRAAKQARRAAAKRAKRGGGPVPPTDLLPHVDKRSADCLRYCVLLAYRGVGYHGWMPQCPPGRAPLRTVGGAVEEAFRRATQQRVRVHPSGRTDAGVSAWGQICQFDAVAQPPPPLLMARLNAQLPADCRVRSVEVAAKDFAAMSGCRWKRYAYTVPGPASHLRDFCHRTLQSSAPSAPATAASDAVPGDLALLADLPSVVARINAAGAVLVGRHDCEFLLQVAPSPPVTVHCGS
jgi:tRNA pseudouridine38-40 synthase